MTTTATSKCLAGRIAGLVAGAIAIAATAWVGYTHNTASFARGVIGGGLACLVFATIAMLVGRRGPAILRLAAGVADEREKAMLNKARAHAFLAVVLVACAFAVFKPDASALAASGSVVWAGLLCTAISLAVQTRRR